jgi:deoxycytidine triphosphate deaminase
MCKEEGLIEPYETRLIRQVDDRRIISCGLSSYGYDCRLARDEFKVFSPVTGTEIDPKNFDAASLLDVPIRRAEDGSEYWLLPPHSYALGVTIERFNMPRRVTALAIGKCITGDAHIVDAETGNLMSLRDFVEQKKNRTTTLLNNKIATTNLQDHIYSGIKPVYALTTRTGRKIKATANHPLLTFNGWVALEDLTPGVSRIAVPRQLPIFGQTEIADHEADLLGFMISDGQCDVPGHSPCYTTADPVLVNRFTEAVERFGCQVSYKGRLGYRVVNKFGRGGMMTGNPNRMHQWLTEMNLNVTSDKKFVPSRIFSTTRKSVARFLRALFSGDGGVTTRGSFVVIEYSSVSERLIRDVQHLLLRFGIVSSIKLKTTNFGTLAWRLFITDKDALSCFAKEIGFVPDSEKQNRLDHALSVIDRHPKSHTNIDSLPMEAWTTIKSLCEVHGRSMLSVGVHARWNQGVGRSLFAQVGEALQETSLIEIASSDVLWDRVESIEYIGEEEVYDLSIPATHNFIANDIVVHNSTYARSGLIANTTPLEANWRGRLVVELYNAANLPVRLYAEEGFIQILFFESDEDCETSYSDRGGKYQDQPGLTLPKL